MVIHNKPKLKLNNGCKMLVVLALVALAQTLAYSDEVEQGKVSCSSVTYAVDNQGVCNGTN